MSDDTMRLHKEIEAYTDALTGPEWYRRLIMATMDHE